MEVKDMKEQDKELLQNMSNGLNDQTEEFRAEDVEESRQELSDAVEAGEIYSQHQESPVGEDLSSIVLGGDLLELRKASMALLGSIRKNKEIIDTSEVQGKQIYNYLMIIFDENEVEASKIVDTLLERTQGKITEDIQALTDEELNEMLTIDGILCKLNINFEDSGIEDPIAYTKYVIDTLSQYNIAKEAGEKASAEARILVEENKTELTKILNKYDAKDIPTLEYKAVTQLMSKAKHSKGELAKTLNAYDNGMSLEPIINLYESIGGKNTIKDLQDPNRRQSVIKKYTNSLKEAGVHSSFSVLVYVQNRLGEEYAQVPGLLSFACMKYISGKTKKEIIDDIAMMLYIVIIAECIVADLIDPSTEKKFMDNCKKLLDTLMA